MDNLVEPRRVRLAARLNDSLDQSIIAQLYRARAAHARGQLAHTRLELSRLQTEREDLVAGYEWQVRLWRFAAVVMLVIVIIRGLV